MRMMLVAAVFLVAGCPSPSPTSTGKIEYVGGSDRPPAEPVRPTDTEPQPEQCVAEKLAASQLADVRTNIRSAPEIALMQLGVTIDEFEPIAHKLYNRWLEAHPEARRRAAAATRPPDPPPVIAPSLPQPAEPERNVKDRTPWWCFESADGDLGDCSMTMSDCNNTRARYLTPGRGGPGEVCAGLTEKECADIAIGVAARIEGIRPCAYQERASCFRQHSNLNGEDDDVCAPTIRACKRRRAFMMKNRADDVRVKSDCIVRLTK